MVVRPWCRDVEGSWECSGRRPSKPEPPLIPHLIFGKLYCGFRDEVRMFIMAGLLCIIVWSYWVFFTMLPITPQSVKVNFYTFTPFCVKTFTYKWNYFSIKFHFLLTLWSVKVNFYTVWCICTPHGEKYFTMRCKFSITFDLIKGKRPPPLKDLILAQN